MVKKHKKLVEFEIPESTTKQLSKYKTESFTLENNKSVSTQKKLQTLKISIKYTLIFLINLILVNAKISGAISPFSLGFCFALLQLNYNPLSIGPIYIFGQIIKSPTLACLTASLSVFASMLIIKGVFLFIKKRPPIYLVPSFMLLGMSGYIYYNVGSATATIQTIIYALVAIMFCYISYNYLRAATTRGILSSFTLDENICFALFAMVFALGLEDIYISNFSVLAAITCFLMLATARTMGNNYSLYFGALSGFGAALSNGSLTSLAIFCSWAVIICALGKSKILSIIGLTVMDFIIGAYFNAYPIYTYVNSLNILIPTILFAAIPNKLYSNVGKKFAIDKSANGVLLAGINGEYLQKKLATTSKLLQNMGENYQKIAIDQNSAINVEQTIAESAIEHSCKNCENYSQCMLVQNMRPAIIELASAGLAKTKATLLDLNNQIAVNCKNTTGLLSSINHTIELFAKREEAHKTDGANVMAIGEQLIGTGKLLKTLSSQISTDKTIDVHLSEIITEELLANDIVAKDVQVQNGKNFVISLIVKTNENEEKLAKILSKTLKIELNSTKNISKYAGYKLITLSPKAKYDISIGIASTKKPMSKESGDNYSVVDLDDNKIMIAICDGMGSGEKASAISEKVLELVENFYKAGFDSDLILKNISHLLSTSEKEIYATLDICIFNKSTGEIDFLKSSAPPSVHKSNQIATLIKGEALPIGIVESTVDTKVKLLQSGDIVVLASDGVVDAFATDEEYAETVNNTKTINMSLFSENLLQEASQRASHQLKAPDDMTILALRVI